MRLMDLSKAQGARVHPVADRGVAHHARCLRVVLDCLTGMALRQQHVLWTAALVATFHDAALYACFDTTQQRDRSVRELIDLE